MEEKISEIVFAPEVPEDPIFAIDGDIPKLKMQDLFSGTEEKKSGNYFICKKYFSPPATNLFEYIALNYQTKVEKSLTEIESEKLKKYGIFRSKNRRNNIYLCEKKIDDIFYEYSVKPVFSKISFILTSNIKSFKFWYNYEIIKEYLNKKYFFTFFPAAHKIEKGFFDHFYPFVFNNEINTFENFCFEKKEVICVSGLRKSGKTTFAYQYLRQKHGFSYQNKRPFAPGLENFIKTGVLDKSYVVDMEIPQDLMKRNPRIIFIKPLYMNEENLVKFSKQLIFSHFLAKKKFPKNLGIKGLTIKIPPNAEILEYCAPDVFFPKQDEYHKFIYYQFR